MLLYHFVGKAVGKVGHMMVGFVGSTTLVNDGSLTVVGREGSLIDVGIKTVGAGDTTVVGMDGTEMLGIDVTEMLGTVGTEMLGIDGTEMLRTNGTEMLGIDGTEILGIDGTEMLGIDRTEMLGTDGTETVGRGGTLIEGKKDLPGLAFAGEKAARAMMATERIEHCMLK